MLDLVGGEILHPGADDEPEAKLLDIYPVGEGKGAGRDDAGGKGSLAGEDMDLSLGLQVPAVARV